MEKEVAIRLEHITKRFGSVVANQDVPLFHKVARQDIKAGQAVVKYGEFIGQATCDIKAGDHVHVHNCASSDALKDAVDVDADVQNEAARPSAPVACTRTFMGYRRGDGRDALADVGRADGDVNAGVGQNFAERGSRVRKTGVADAVKHAADACSS